MLYRNVQALRGVAALAVAVFHLLTSVDGFFRLHGKDAGSLSFVADWSRPLGIVGVDIFFVISGFVLVMSGERLLSRSDDNQRLQIATTFAIHRFLRVYPPYWVVYAAAAVFASSVTPGSTLATLIDGKEFLLVDISNQYGLIPQAWTLMYEIYFYACLTVCLLFGASGFLTALCTWFAVQTLVVMATWFGVIGNVNPITDAVLLDFMGGCVIALSMLRRRTPHPWTAILLSTIPLVLGLIFVWNGENGVQLDRVYRVLTTGLFSIAIVYAFIHLEQSGQLRIKGMQLLGNASYSVYLWHVLVYNIAGWIGLRLGLYDFQHPYLIALVWLCLAIVVGLISYRLIEMPILKAMNERRMSLLEVSRLIQGRG